MKIPDKILRKAWLIGCRAKAMAEKRIVNESNWKKFERESWPGKNRAMSKAMKALVFFLHKQICDSPTQAPRRSGARMPKKERKVGMRACLIPEKHAATRAA